jgi:hypothetical protein
VYSGRATRALLPKLSSSHHVQRETRRSETPLNLKTNTHVLALPGSSRLTRNTLPSGAAKPSNSDVDGNECEDSIHPPSSLWLIKVQQPVVSENEGSLTHNVTHPNKVRIQTPVVLTVDVDLTLQYILEISRIIIPGPDPATSPHMEYTAPAIQRNSSSRNEPPRKSMNFTSHDELH